MVCLSLGWISANALSSNDLVPAFIATAQAQQNTQQIQALFLAVENNDLEAVRNAISDGASVDSRDFNGMQPVDLAIDRGFFEIAHYLISVRNNQDTPKAPDGAPASMLTPKPNPVVPNLATQAPDIAAPANNPFDAPIPPATELLTLDGIKEPPKSLKSSVVMPKDTNTPVPSSKTVSSPKQSATRRFFSTFSDFFKPANTTGITRKARPEKKTKTVPLTDTALNAHLQQLQHDLGPVLDMPRTLKKSPAIADILQNDPTQQNHKSGSTDRPSSSKPSSSGKSAPNDGPGADPFGDLKIVNTSDSNISNANRKPIIHPINTNKPFGGQVDPDIVDFLNNYGRNTPTSDPMAADAGGGGDPFGGLEVSDSEGTKDAPIPQDGISPPSSTDPFASLDPPQEIATLTPKSPPSRAAPNDPFAPLNETPNDPFSSLDSAPKADSATSTADPFATPADSATNAADPLAGLLDTSPSPNSGWSVKKIARSKIPNEVELLNTIEPTGHILKDAHLTLGADTTIGQQVGPDRLTMMKEDTIHKPCLSKGGDEAIYCLDKIDWPFELEDDFLVDTIMYQGTSAVSRYDAEKATNFHTLFKSASFAKIIKYYIDRFGQPSKVVQRAIAPLAQSRMDNPTYIWESRESGTDNFTALEIRKYDDARGSFPDTKRGVILLYQKQAGSIFPQLSQLELMVLKANAKPGDNRGAAAKPETVW